ncbi:conserved hypothetical protein [Agrobacterium sp. NCPPB 925]|nr:conserved hypothetical protein [Agrobacterium sp. NCPPB 925]
MILAQIFQPLDELRRLRKRIAHYEPALNRNIAPRYDSLLDLIGYISQATAWWVDDQSSVMEVLA